MSALPNEDDLSAEQYVNAIIAEEERLHQVRGLQVAQGVRLDLVLPRSLLLALRDAEAHPHDISAQQGHISSTLFYIPLQISVSPEHAQDDGSESSGRKCA